MTRSERRRRRARQVRRQRILLVAAVLALGAVSASFTFAEPEESVAVAHAKEPLATEVAFKQEDGELSIITLPAEASESLEADTVEQETAEVQPVEESEEPETVFFEEIPLDQETQTCVLTWCEEYGVPHSIALSVIQSESSFQADAENGSCYGYMQINSINREWLGERIGITDLTDPHQNIQAGIYMLSDLYGKYGDWNKALTCYNYGEGGAYEHVFSKGETSTTYSRHVLAVAEEWSEVVGDD